MSCPSPRRRPHIYRKAGIWRVMPGLFAGGPRRNYISVRNSMASRYAWELNEGIR